MRFVYENAELELRLKNARTLEALDQVLTDITNSVPNLFEASVYGQQLYAAGLDAALSALPRRLGLTDVPMAKGNDNVVVLATRFYETGGHSRVAADIIQRVGSERVTVIFTDAFHQLRYPQLPAVAPAASGYSSRAVLLLSAPTLGQKVLELYAMLSAIRPSRIFLLNNHMDAVAVAGAWPFRSVVDFIHHTDYLPGLGASLPFSSHVDLTYSCHMACHEAGLDPIYAGLTVPDREPAPLRTVDPQRLRIATCAGMRKYQGRMEYRWIDYAIATLRVLGTELIHIGPTDAAFETDIREALAAASIDPVRYAFAGFTPDLRAELIRREVDLYLSSFPETGGKANLEAMSAGIPVIVPRPPGMPTFVRYRLPPGRWIALEAPDEVSGALSRALELREAMNTPEGALAFARDLNRFDDVVDMKPVAPVTMETLD